MRLKHKLLFLSLLTLAISFHFGSVSAQIYNKPSNKAAPEAKASQMSLEYAKQVSKTCLNGRWENQDCLEIVSASTRDMASVYAEKLDKADEQAALDVLKNQCAAATAATKGEYPAYAMLSAYTECANIIADIAEETNIIPDQSHYQITVGAVLCLSKNRMCSAVESGLSQY